MAVRGVTVRDALDSAVVAIGASGSPTARLDAEILLAHALGVDRTALVLHPEREVTGAAVRAFQGLVRRRSAEHAPVAYLVGRRGFRRLELDVDERVLIPRPETELLVEVGLELPLGARVVDVGTGSGAIALALKHERPDLRVVATDVSTDALAVARANAAGLGLEVELVQADLLPAEGAKAFEGAASRAAWDAPSGAMLCDAAADEGLGPPYDAVLSNPPYVRDGDPLPADVARHEPAGALRAGPDGLDVLRRLMPAAAAVAPLLAVEHGAGQAGAVEALAREAGFARVERRRDLAGHERVVVARR